MGGSELRAEAALTLKDKEARLLWNLRRHISREAEKHLGGQFSSAAANGPAAHATMTEHAGPDCERN